MATLRVISWMVEQWPGASASMARTIMNVVDPIRSYFGRCSGSSESSTDIWWSPYPLAMSVNSARVGCTRSSQANGGSELLTMVRIVMSGRCGWPPQRRRTHYQC
jgi:hypothetical protein